MARNTLDLSARDCIDTAMLEVVGLVKRVQVRRRSITVLEDVNLRIDRGVSVGVVGESGCGKSTLAEIIVGLQTPSEGSIRFRGVALDGADRATLNQARAEMRMVFQDPYSSLDPRLQVIEIVAEPLRYLRQLTKQQRRTRAAELLAAVGLSPALHATYRPKELSGGQAQRVAIARALATDPMLLVLDEAVSSLDVSVRAQILNLLHDLAEAHGLTYMFIAHDLDAVRYVSDMVVVMYLGRICEVLPSSSIGETDMHPYAELLFGADRVAVWERGHLESNDDAGEPPSIFRRPSGCPYRTRCREASEVCVTEIPPLRVRRGGGFVACHHR